ncbi:hypothetical protein AGMMS49965_09980 [Bacteroidia bacterium]|nr:hypothetical protein AGMMS49965_09980 [Bacteroidia bacterium]
MVEVMDRIKSYDVEELMKIEAFVHALRLKKAAATKQHKASVKCKVSIANELCGILKGYEGDLDHIREDRLSEKYGLV